MDKDITGVAVERAAKVLSRVKTLFNIRVPYGPARAKMTPKEARKFWENLSPDARLRFAQSMGLNEYMDMIGRLYGRN